MVINPNTHDYNKFDIKRYIHMQLIEYIIFLVVRGLQIALSVIIPYYLGICIDQIISDQNRLSLQYFVMWFFVLAVMEFALSCIVNELNVRLSNKITFQIEFDTLKHIKYVPYSIIQKYDDAYLSQRINNDSVTIGDYVVEKLLFLLRMLH